MESKQIEIMIGKQCVNYVRQQQTNKNNLKICDNELIPLFNQTLIESNRFALDSMF